MQFSHALGLALCIGAAAAASGCEKTTAMKSSEPVSLGAAGNRPIDAGSATIWVQGMGCPLCANNVDQQLSKVPGVSHVDLNLGTGEVRVALEQGRQPSRAQLAQAIRNTGFTLVKIDVP